MGTAPATFFECVRQRPQLLLVDDRPIDHGNRPRLLQQRDVGAGHAGRFGLDVGRATAADLDRIDHRPCLLWPVPHRRPCLRICGVDRDRCERGQDRQHERTAHGISRKQEAPTVRRWKVHPAG
jgi:hypothetical protein